VEYKQVVLGRQAGRFEAIMAGRFWGVHRGTFLRQGFSDSNPGVGKASVDAVSRMPANLRAGFLEELQHILENPNENAQTKAQADAVLTGVQ